MLKCRAFYERKSMSDLESDPRREVLPRSIEDELRQSYLDYAMSVIVGRALPDVRDGLKPVHRRVLYAMHELGNDWNKSYKKSARIVGDVIGKYHPHGDQSIYDALVRLAQDFAVRYPLVDGQGNFGNIDGDNAAAMRYTESRMTEAAILLLDGIDQDTVDFRDNYDGNDTEPAVLPAAYPNLLANGASGIAVGMATSIPPHNVAELIDASIHIIKYPNASARTLVEKYVKGPDFPTGGVCIEPQENIIEAYATGKGGFRLRCRWETEELARGKYQIVITEIPYQVQKSRLIEKIADLIQNRKLPLLADIRDESAEDIRLILEPKSQNVEPPVLMEMLFKQTDLETRISLNMNVLDAKGTPRVFSLRESLQAFLTHRKEVLVRRTNFRLGKIAHRLEMLDGFIIAFLNLDEVIRIIRYEDEPKAELIKAFDLTDLQAEGILNMRLRSLRKLEELELKKERKDLRKEQKDLKALLKSDDLQWKKITTELRDVKKAFDPKSDLGKRRTVLEDAPDVEEIDLDDLIEKEPVTIILSEKGWVRTMKGHVEKTSDIKYKDGDREGHIMHAMTNDKVMLFGTNGKFYSLDVRDLPGGRGHGEPIRLMVDLGNDHSISQTFLYSGARTLLVASTAGHGFFVKESDCLATTKKGKQVLNVSGDAEAIVCRLLDEAPGKDAMLASVGSNKKLLIFPAEELPTMTRGKGVVLQKFSAGILSDAKVFKKKEGLSWKDRAERVQSESKWKGWVGKRAQAGKIVPKGFPRALNFGRD